MLHNFSLRTKLAAFVVLVVGVTGWVIAGFVLWHDYRSEQENLRNDGLALATMYQHVLLDPLRQEEDFHTFELLAAPFYDANRKALGTSRRALQHVILLDDQGKVLASSDPVHIPLLTKYSEVEPEFEEASLGLPQFLQGMAPRWIKHDEVRGLYLLVPVGENGVKYATLVMDYSMQVIVDSFIARALQSLGIISLISFVLMLLVYRLAQRLSDPLARLMQEMRQLAERHGWRVVADSRQMDEIMQLQNTFREFECGLLNAELQRDESLQRERLALAALDHSSQGVVITTLDASIIYINNAYCNNVGYSQNELLGQNPHFMQSGKTPAETYQSLWAALTAEQSWQGELINRRKDGSEYLELITISPIRQADGQISHYLAIQDDISERRAAEDHIRHLAEHDALTGLPNRALLEDRLEQAIKSATRNNERLALMFMDLDNFKQVNDLQGHYQGDQLLKLVAQRLLETLRASDTLARLGGDEFVLLAPINSEAEAQLLAAKIVQILSEPYFQENAAELNVSVSIGISLYPEHAQTAEALTMCADIAMYQAKARGRDTYCLFSPEMQGDLRDRVTLEGELRLALQQRQFVLHYQPQFDAQTGEVGGLEALIRWQHPQYGLLYPDNFIAAAESSGLIVEIGAWVIDEACRQVRVWLDAGLVVPCLAVNVSFKQFHGHDLQGTVTAALERYRLSGASLELELTESVMLRDPDRVYAVLHGLRLMGVRLSIDDFGSGYSSLMYLKRLDVDTLKIDRAFVIDIHSEKGRAMVEAIIKIAQTLKLHTVAEGVETVTQLTELRNLNCGEIQGFLLGKPMLPEQVEVLLTESERHNLIDQIMPANNFVI